MKAGSGTEHLEVMRDEFYGECQKMPGDYVRICIQGFDIIEYYVRSRTGSAYLPPLPKFINSNDPMSRLNWIKVVLELRVNN